MGSSCKSRTVEIEEYPEIKLAYKDLKGQYNNYKVQSDFDIYLNRKMKTEKGFNIEGYFIEKKQKYKLSGEISKESLKIEINFSDSVKILFQGNMNIEFDKYLGTYEFTGNVQKNIGNFWIKVLDKTFWIETYKSVMQNR